MQGTLSVYIAHYFKIMVYIGLYCLFFLGQCLQWILLFFKLENCLYQPSYVPVFQVCRPEGASSVISKIVLVMVKQQPSLK